MKLNQIIKSAIPDADDSLCEYILWSRTPFPAGKITAKSLYKAASRFKRAQHHNIKICDFCDNMLQPEDNGLCKRCKTLMDGCGK